jgi:hypothetical protein
MHDSPTVFFGYSFVTDAGDSDEVIRELYDLNGMIREPFQIFSIIPSYDDVDHIKFVIGFIPHAIREAFELSLILDEYVDHNPLFECMILSKQSTFHAGFEWCPEASESISELESLDLSSETSDESELSYDDLTSEEST